MPLADETAMRNPLPPIQSKACPTCGGAGIVPAESAADARAALLAAVEKMRETLDTLHALIRPENGTVGSAVRIVYTTAIEEADGIPGWLDAALSEARAPLEATITELRDEIEQHLLVIREHQRIVVEAREEQKREDASVAGQTVLDEHDGAYGRWTLANLVKTAILRGGEGG